MVPTRNVGINSAAVSSKVAELIKRSAVPLDGIPLRSGILVPLYGMP
jgi:hypothetical protein